MVETQDVELGRYRILAEIGRGSSGTVYRALDTLIGREVAIKSFHSPDRDAPGEPLRDELLREARSAGMLSHPNVVTVYDVVEGNDGSWLMAMEYVEGRSLARILAEDGPPEFERTVDWISQIAAALDYLHALDLVHRDVKPANVLVTGAGRLKLTDFGVASSARRAGSEEARGAGADDTEAILGTPAYMAPEQLLGREITPRADVWSLGVVLYELLTGRRPFEGRSVADAVHRVIHAPAPAPAELRSAGGGGAIPDGVRELLDRALAKDPSWRFASAGELARELRRVLYGTADETDEGDLTPAAMLERTLVSEPASGSTSGSPAGPATETRGSAVGAGRGPAFWRRAWDRLHPASRAALAALVIAPLALGALFAYRGLVPEAGTAEAGGLGVPEPEGRASEETAPDDGTRIGVAARGAAPSGIAASAPRVQVRIEFWSDAPEGALTVYGGGDELLHRGFSYYEWGWIFRRAPSTGGFEEEIAVPASLEALQVYVARSGSPAHSLEVPVNLEPGAHRVLRIHLPAAGEATAVWE